MSDGSVSSASTVISIFTPRLRPSPNISTLSLSISGSTHFVRQNGECLASGVAGDLISVKVPEGERINIRAHDIRTGIGIPHDRILEIASRHFGVALPRNLVFQPNISMQSGVLSELRRVVGVMLKTPEDGDGDTQKARAAFESAIALSLLLTVPSNVSHLLRRSGDIVAPGYVNRALDFMRHNLFEEVTIEDIADAAGCTPRNLQLTFRNVFGELPMRRLRKLRLEYAKRQLQGCASESVTQIAVSLGYSNTGRFSKDYQLMFGTKPSQALRSKRALAESTA